jgi:prepilin-type processing-associated H-X9-DG protein
VDEHRFQPARLSMLEVAVSLWIVVVLLVVLIPALGAARAHSHLQRCAAHQRQLGAVWDVYLNDHEGLFPFVPVQPGWRYGGVRFSAVSDEPFLDYQRPLNSYVGTDRLGGAVHDLFRCPADHGITHPHGEVGTGGRTAYRSYGTSFRLNAVVADARIAPVSEEPRGLYRHEITTTASRFVLMGDPVWHEIYEATGRDASWHGEPGVGNILFLDGSVRFMSIRPRGQRGAAVAEPSLRRSGLWEP